nr:MAG TPA: hypothetical protein [Caudoviricetes sp.]
MRPVFCRDDWILDASVSFLFIWFLFLSILSITNLIKSKYR